MFGYDDRLRRVTFFAEQEHAHALSGSLTPVRRVTAMTAPARLMARYPAYKVRGMYPFVDEIPESVAAQLPAPTKGRATSVFDALKLRKTTREISPRPLPLQELSNLLWAACGVNRKIGPFGVPGRTAASASNSQEIDLYVA